jgi:2-hydroxycyclohexanecarboxyl-CoA dehydrogenase
LPLTAAASGTVASISSEPGASTSLRFVSVSDWLRNGTLRMTVRAACAAPALSWPLNVPSGPIAAARSAVSCAREASREPITTGTPARASLVAMPKPSAPEAPMTATGSAVDGAKAPEYRLHGMRLEGKVALVTGGASGIGAATSRRLAAEGARVAIGDVDLDGARAVASELDGLACTMDVTDTRSVRTAVAGINSELGDIDLLVNNAGTDRFSFFVNTDEELWDFVLGVNLRGVLAVTHSVLASMQDRRSGAIVNVASEAGRVGSQGSAVYSSAKAGVIGFTKAIAREAARYRVRCNAVAPGPIETPLLNAAPAVLGEIGERMKQGMVNSTLLGRAGEPEEVASAIAFLASDDACYITGQTLNVSGGLSMW